MRNRDCGNYKMCQRDRVLKGGRSPNYGNKQAIGNDLIEWKGESRPQGEVSKQDELKRR